MKKTFLILKLCVPIVIFAQPKTIFIDNSINLDISICRQLPSIYLVAVPYNVVKTGTVVQSLGSNPPPNSINLVCEDGGIWGEGCVGCTGGYSWYADINYNSYGFVYNGTTVINASDDPIYSQYQGTTIDYQTNPINRLSLTCENHQPGTPTCIGGLNLMLKKRFWFYNYNLNIDGTNRDISRKVFIDSSQVNDINYTIKEYINHINYSITNNFDIYDQNGNLDIPGSQNIKWERVNSDSVNNLEKTIKFYDFKLKYITKNFEICKGAIVNMQDYFTSTLNQNITFPTPLINNSNEFNTTQLNPNTYRIPIEGNYSNGIIRDTINFIVLPKLEPNIEAIEYNYTLNTLVLRALPNNADSYLWNTLETTQSITVPLAAGTYTCTVSYSNPGCIASIQYEVKSNLPVTLISFTGHSNKNRVKLTWDVTNEINFEKYVIEKSTNSINFIPINEIQAKGTISNIITNYITEILQNENKAWYRIKLVDKDGRYEYSKIIIIIADEKNINTVKVYPNPIRKGDSPNVLITINRNIPKCKITIYNSLGQVILIEYIKLYIGNNTIQINLKSINNLSTNLYCTLSDESNNSQIITKFNIMQIPN